MVSNRSASAEWQLSPTTSTLRATHTAEHHALRPAILPRNDSRGEGGGRQNRRRQGSKTGILYLRAGGLASGSNNGRSQQASASVVLGLGLCCPSIAKPSSTDMFKPRPRKKHLPLGGPRCRQQSQKCRDGMQHRQEQPEQRPPRLRTDA